MRSAVHLAQALFHSLRQSGSASIKSTPIGRWLRKANHWMAYPRWGLAQVPVPACGDGAFSEEPGFPASGRRSGRVG
jgi:hypothetical protein